MLFLRASASQKGLKGKQYETLSSSSKNFGSEKNNEKNYKGGALAPPFVMFFVGFSATQNCSDWCLSLVFFSFQSSLACRGSQKLHFVDLGLT